MSLFRRIFLILEGVGSILTGAYWAIGLVDFAQGGITYGPLTGTWDIVVLPAIVWGIPFVLARIGLPEEEVLEINEKHRKIFLAFFCTGMFAGLLYISLSYVFSG